MPTISLDTTGVAEQCKLLSEKSSRAPPCLVATPDRCTATTGLGASRAPRRQREAASPDAPGRSRRGQVGLV
jgi:hypothetical protein